jgi:DNA-binding transcriptional LysR family regulator
MKDVTSAYGSSSTHSISNDPSQDDYCQVGKGISLASSRGLLDVVERMERVRGRVALFDPSTARRTFRIRMTDISEMVLLPSLLNRLRKEAPEVVIEAVKVSVDSQPQLDSADLDLAVGFMPTPAALPCAAAVLRGQAALA